MDSVVLYLAFAIIASVFTVSMPQGDTCRACNCQFDNIQALNQLIKEEIAAGKLHVANATAVCMYTKWVSQEIHTHSVRVSAIIMYSIIISQIQ